ncbi:MAG: hypothetical protein HC799_01320 [Limnothrix sp. RL_2_0]|nr:hypothetical protein [Limnothrix sp. RL_2_0]
MVVSEKVLTIVNDWAGLSGESGDRPVSWDILRTRHVTKITGARHLKNLVMAQLKCG